MNASCNWVDLLQVSSVHVLLTNLYVYVERTRHHFISNTAGGSIKDNTSNRGLILRAWRCDIHARHFSTDFSVVV